MHRRSATICTVKHCSIFAERANCTDNELAFRHEAMALAERDRWEELAGVARRQSVLRPAQRWPWLALGLAEHRLGHSDRASVAFDSGFARLPKLEREHLMSLSRLLPTLQQTFFDTLSAPAKEQLSGMYWNVASPTLLLDDNPVLDEFRARVVYADLLWTNEEVRQRGASTIAVRSSSAGDRPM